MRLNAALSIVLVLSLTGPAIAGETSSNKKETSEVKKHNAYLKQAHLKSYSQTYCYSQFDELTPAYEKCVKQIMHPK
jgi:hypothetical protein